MLSLYNVSFSLMSKLPVMIMNVLLRAYLLLKIPATAKCTVRIVVTVTVVYMCCFYCALMLILIIVSVWFMPWSAKIYG